MSRGYTIKKYREALGWSQQHLADRLGEAGMTVSHQQTVAKIEVGRRSIELGEAVIIAHVLGVEIADLVAINDDQLRAKALERWRLRRADLESELAAVDVEIAGLEAS